MTHFGQIDTPALLLDADALEANLQTMASFFAHRHSKLRPHFKSHKCTTIARLQMKAGAVGITCAKLGEAEVVAAAGIRNILIANQIVGPLKIRRLVNLCRRAEPMVAVDSADNVIELAESAVAAGVRAGFRVGDEATSVGAGGHPGDRHRVADVVFGKAEFDHRRPALGLNLDRQLDGQVRRGTGQEAVDGIGGALAVGDRLDQVARPECDIATGEDAGRGGRERGGVDLDRACRREFDAVGRFEERQVRLLADGQHTIGDMARVIAEEYEVSLGKAEADVLAFCRDLEGRGLLTLGP